ncbi:GAF domain-containing protein [Flavobacterium sp.]|uniref:GAF domain-containing protein n=1 Tax=Flavobacterium sp. TaxID=239 RepID=UPI002639EFDB|nr:GAF domain-containing protein [Flavobacterium sp.]
MILKEPIDNPFEVQISFHRLLENLEEIANSDVDYRAHYAQGLLKAAAKVPELRDGIKDFDTIKMHKHLIGNLLADLFPTALTNNEIKAVTIPFHNIVFNYSARFQQILNNAGPDFDMEVRDFTDERFYVMSCCMILNGYYGHKFDFAKPFFYDIPDGNGIQKHYRILYNADFIEILPTEKSKPITAEDIEILIDNFEDTALWKEKFPPQSWIMRGFGIMSLYDATVESAVSNLKTNLLSPKQELDTEIIRESFQGIFRSIFQFNDLRIGYSSIDPVTNKFTVSPFEKNIHSFLSYDDAATDCGDFLCHSDMPELIKEQKYFVISDVEKFHSEHPKALIGGQLLAQDIQSAIFAPVVKNGTLLGVIELVSATKKRLNSINSNKLDIVLPYLIDTIDRYYSDIRNQIEALIQKEYTTIHPSVYWKFREEAFSHLNDAASLHEIVFNNVYPLFGQIDIKGSSEKRNATTKDDILVQVNLLKDIFEAINAAKKLPVFEQKVFELEQYVTSIASDVKADSEQIIQRYIKQEIHPILKMHQPEATEIKKMVAAYFDALDANSETVYASRKKFDATVSIINKKMANILDKKQVEAQEYYPHYYERFKTDGVEHNMYIGNSITNEPQFNFLYLYNLRLWQLQVMCDMENEYHKLQPSLPFPMEVASLILVINLPITIRFRMDEKRFDVDGSYNARYEVVKKRIDKAFIKGTTERITAQNKITIVYAQQEEGSEYKRYIAFLQHKKRLGPEVEFFDVEDLQGVSGLKGIRVSVMYDQTSPKLYSYNELVSELGN